MGPQLNGLHFLFTKLGGTLASGFIGTLWQPINRQFTSLIFLTFNDKHMDISQFVCSQLVQGGESVMYIIDVMWSEK